MSSVQLGSSPDLASSGPDSDETTLELISRYTDPPEQGWRRLWNWLSESANPIVVKEARQALHSRQFTISFSMTLAAVAVWTVMAIILQLPNIYYLPGGLWLLSGYLAILAFPLLLVIPFSAFRSMVTESEERTFELVSISALSANQIVQGKLLSAVLQTIVYLSALAPCIVVTYLLRGVSLAVILNFLFVTVMFSLVLTGGSILVATISRSRFIQVFASICVLGGLMIAFIYWGIVAAVSLSELNSFTGPIERFGWLFVAALASIVLSFLWVSIRCSAAAIDFPTENHAFPLRLRLLIATVIVLFWGLWLAIAVESYEVCITFLIVAFFGFLLVGGLVAGERGLISPRAQRTLPRTMLGRVFLTWFYPGAGLGYIFLTCLLTSVVSCWIVLGILSDSLRLGISYGESIAAVGLVVLSYFVFYTGLTRLIMLAIPRTVAARVVVAFFIQVLAVATGTLGSYSVILAFYGFQHFDYSWVQALNVLWTLNEFAESGITTYNSPTLVLLPLLAMAVFVLNLILCGRDVMLLRVGLPPRLREELETQTAETPLAPDPFA